MPSVHKNTPTQEEGTVWKKLAVADNPGGPMVLGELATLMKSDYDKLAAIVKTSGMAGQ
ncbi:hypothetical protein [Bradyrhizobium sp. AS23.2]|uniref:hypothetical protein n=1 Tax=Bradyrhizobium sp. AS23.2 TaxID=1680155 RepID=UPI00143149DB|nr:hypothetical protein [Bradyrhizobium sp. AS23.2]